MKKTGAVVLSCILVLLAVSFGGCAKTVSGYELVIDYNGTTYSGEYFGTIKHKVPQDNKKGKFISGEEGSGKFLEYDGEWKDGSFFGKGTLKKENYEINYSDEIFKGSFEGTTVNGIPNGTGTYIVKDNNKSVFEYEGEWKQGQISGKGKLNYSKYVIEYSDGTVRTGTFEGDVQNGIPQGQGTFTTKNDDNEEYTYTGTFSNGKFNGSGKKAFKNGKYGVQDGNWKDNDFNPSLVERIQELGTYKDDCEYELSDEAKKFIENNETTFINHKAEKINTDFSFKSFQKNPTSFKPSIVRIKGLKVVQISEYKSFGDKMLTYMLACDADYNNYYYVYKLDKTKGIVTDNTVTLTFMPLDYSTYETTSGSENWAVVGFAVDIEK